MGRKVGKIKNTLNVLALTVIIITTLILYSINVTAICTGTITPLFNCEDVSVANCGPVLGCQVYAVPYPPSCDQGTPCTDHCCTGTVDECTDNPGISPCSQQTDAACALIPGCVVDSCSGLTYTQCIAPCVPQGTTYVVYDDPCSGIAAPCNTGDSIISQEIVGTEQCCTDEQVGCVPETASAYWIYEDRWETTCISDYECVSTCGVGMNLCPVGGADICVNPFTTDNACGASCEDCTASEQTCVNGVCTGFVCGAEEIVYFDEPFNDNSNGWKNDTSTPLVLIEGGYLKRNMHEGVNTKVPFNYLNKKITFTIRESSSYTGATLKVIFVDEANMGYLYNVNDIIIEGCASYMFTQYSTLGIIMYPGTPGVERTCSVTVKDVRIKNANIHVIGDYGEIWVDHIKMLPFSDQTAGHVFGDGIELCYDNRSLLRYANNNWELKNALVDAFRIYPVNYSNQGVSQADFVSNSEKWYYCNASNTVPEWFSGKAVPEYGTFDVPSYFVGDNVYCYVALSLIPGMPTFINGCPDPNGIACCDNQNGPYEAPPDKLYTCFESDMCEASGWTPESFCEQHREYCGGSTTPEIDAIIDFLQAENCEDPLSFCFELSIYNPEQPCNSTLQLPVGTTSLKYINCSVTQVCYNGVFLPTTPLPPGGACCFGGLDSGCADTPQEFSECMAIPSVRSREIDLNTEMCVPPEDAVWDWTTNVPRVCCPGLIMNKTSGHSVPGKPESFRCFNLDGKSIFSECGSSSFDVANSYLLFGSLSIYRYSKARVSSLGDIIYIFNNFDKYNDSSSNLVELIPRVSPYPYYIDVGLTDPNFPNVTHFSYFEFDIRYSHKHFNVTLNYLSDPVPINISKYLVGDDQIDRWHHIIIPLKDFPQITRLNNIRFTPTNASLLLYYDNFMFRPEGADLLYTSQTQYCSGGFREWINDLDPDLNTYAWSDPFFSSWLEFGPYSFTCGNYYPFGWTGHQCCGDDTRIYAGGLRNYGEFYNDTSGGCFNGTRIPEGFSVSYRKGYLEHIPDEFNNYIYNDLLFINRSFLGCQVAVNHYDGLLISYNGTIQPGLHNQGIDLLFNDNNNVQSSCAVRGSYYCFDNAWRQLLNAEGYLGDWTEEGLSLKSAPPGGELINNGVFGG